MAISGFLFLSWRLFEIVFLIPPVGMLAWFVHGYVSSNQLTPNFVLVLFIASVLALAWAFFTTISYLRARHDALFVALVDLGFVGALIAGVVELRAIAKANCGNFTHDPFWIDLGVFGYYGAQSGSQWASNPSKNCSVLKASFAFGIIDILAFFLTFLLALLVHRHHRNDDEVVVERKVVRHSSSHRRSGSRDPRSNRGDYRGDYRRPASRDYGRPASRDRRSTQRSSSRRRDAYV